MGERKTFVRDIMTNTPVFVYQKSTIARVFETMKKFGLDSIPIVNDDLFLSGVVNKNFLMKLLNSKKEDNLFKNKRVTDVIDKSIPPVVLYPDMKLEEAYSTMNYLNIKGLPVADRPWEKKIIGFLWRDDLNKTIEENYLKVSI